MDSGLFAAVFSRTLPKRRPFPSIPLFLLYEKREPRALSVASIESHELFSGRESWLPLFGFRGIARKEKLPPLLPSLSFFVLDLSRSLFFLACVTRDEIPRESLRGSDNRVSSCSGNSKRMYIELIVASPLSVSLSIIARILLDTDNSPNERMDDWTRGYS